MCIAKKLAASMLALCLMASCVVTVSAAEDDSSYPKGLVNGYTQGMKNGAVNGMAGGLKNGTVNGLTAGLKNGTVNCLKNGTLTPATVVDHIVPHRGDHALFWDKQNWQPLCKDCHDRKTGQGM